MHEFHEARTEKEEALIEACPECGELLDVTDQDFYALANCPRCKGPFRVRTILPDYSLDSFVTDGALGPVLRATDLADGRQLILKSVSNRHQFTPDSIRRFESEAQIIAGLNHPHILPFLSFGEHYGRYFLISDFAEKGNLADLIHLQGQIAEAQVLEIAIQVTDALNAAAQAGVLHHDVKPANIMFAAAGHAKLADFGLAMLLEEEAAARGEIWGTPNYLSPEKLQTGTIDFRSDMYSLGCTLYHALAGRPPFEANNAEQVARKHLETPAVRIALVATNVSKPTDTILDRMLEKSPDERYQSYDELLLDLRQAKSALIAAVKRRSTAHLAAKQSGKLASKSQKLRSGRVNLPYDTQHLGGPAPEAPKKRLGLWIGIGAAVLVAGAGIVALSSGTKNAKSVPKEPVPAASTTPEAVTNPEVAEDFRHANALIQSRDYPAAQALFSKLAGPTSPATPEEKAVAQAELGAVSLLSDRLTAARDQLKVLRTVKFGSDQRSTIVLQSTLQGIGNAFSDLRAIPPESLHGFGFSSSDYVASLYYGLKNWNTGNLQTAAQFLTTYSNGTLPKPLEWAEVFRPTVQRYLEAFKGYDALLNQINSAAKSNGTNAEALASLQKLRTSIPLQGAFRNRLEQIEYHLKNSSLLETTKWLDSLPQ